MKNINAIVLTYDQNRVFTENMIKSYENIWTDHPFIFHIPYQKLNKINVKREQGAETINLNDFIERFCYNLSISEKDMEIIKEISNTCKSLNLIYDNTPPAMASGCIYLLLQLKKIDISKKMISENCNISEVTINKCYKKLLDTKELMSIIQSKYVFTP